MNAKLKDIMVGAFREILAVARRGRCDMRTAAYLVAVQRVADAMQMRGLYPYLSVACLTGARDRPRRWPLVY